METAAAVNLYPDLHEFYHQGVVETGSSVDLPLVRLEPSAPPPSVSTWDNTAYPDLGQPPRAEQRAKQRNVPHNKPQQRQQYPRPNELDGNRQLHKVQNRSSHFNLQGHRQDRHHLQHRNQKLLHQQQQQQPQQQHKQQQQQQQQKQQQLNHQLIREHQPQSHFHRQQKHSQIHQPSQKHQQHQHPQPQNPPHHHQQHHNPRHHQEHSHHQPVSVTLYQDQQHHRPENPPHPHQYHNLFNNLNDLSDTAPEEPIQDYTLELEPDYDTDLNQDLNQHLNLSEHLNNLSEHLNNLNLDASEQKLLKDKQIEVPRRPKDSRDFQAWMTWRLQANKLLAAVILIRKGKDVQVRRSEVRRRPLTRQNVQNIVQEAKTQPEVEGATRDSAERTSLGGCPYIMYGIPRVRLPHS